MSVIAFTEEQVERYSRHILVPEIGGGGQAALLNASAFVVGAGGLGAPALLYLAAAGVGRLGLADGDQVELSNLQRQIIHGTGDVGKAKAVSAWESLREINPDCQLQVHCGRLTAHNARDLLTGYDVVLDGSDNFPTRFAVADTCWLEGIPLVTASVLGFEGHLMTVLPKQGNACYRCFIPEPPPPDLAPSCQTSGVLASLVGVLGTLQATEALKLLMGVGHVPGDRLLVYDALSFSFRTLPRRPDPQCRLCGEHRTIYDPVEYDAGCTAEPTG